MKRLLQLAALVTAFFLFAEAGAQELCAELPAKEWTATVAVGSSGWGTGSYFEKAGCTWNGLDSLNGVDAYVLDISEYAGLPLSIELTGSTGPVQPINQGLFLNAACQRAGFFGTGDRGVPITASAPLEAKWIVITPRDAGQISVKISSAGRTCTVEAPKPPKKHKKKKKPRH